MDFAKYLNSIGCRNEIYNVGCMYWNYEPVTLDEIIEGGRTIRPNYGERSDEYTVKFPWEKKPSIYPQDDITWNVFYHNSNSRSIETSISLNTARSVSMLRRQQEGANKEALRYAAPQGGYVLFLVKV